MVGLRESLREILRVGVGPDQYLIERVRLLACVQEESVANGIITDWILTDEARRSLAAALRRRVPHGAHSSLARDESPKEPALYWILRPAGRWTQVELAGRSAYFRVCAAELAGHDGWYASDLSEGYARLRREGASPHAARERLHDAASGVAERGRGWVTLDQNQEVVRTCANDDLAEAVALVLAVQFIADG